MEKYLTAIAFIPASATEREKFVKYRKINCSKIDRFKKFLIEKYPTFRHINFYWKESKSFYLQLKRDKDF